MLYDRSGGSQISYATFGTSFRIYVFDLIMEDSVFDAKQNFQLSFDIRHTDPGEDWQIWAVIESMRKATITGLSSKINFEK